MKLLLQIIAEYFQGNIKKNPSLLSLSVVQFTNESWLDGIIRQGRLDEHTYYYGVDKAQQA